MQLSLTLNNLTHTHTHTNESTQGRCANCCKVCCYSTPFGTISALSVTVVGLVGFLSSSVYGVVMVDASEDLQNQ